MHKRFVLNIISRIVLIGCCSMIFPLLWGIHDNVHSKEVAAFIKSIIIGSVFSGLFLFLFPIKKEDYKKINAKDGLAVVGLAWIFLSALGALPLYFSQVVTTYTDAFFEIASGFTTTGATIFTDIEILPRGILFWRSFTHWLGGMGIIVLYIALLPALGSNAFQLYKAEAPGLNVERVEPRIKETAKHLWVVYFIFTFVQAILYMAGGMSLFESLCHTFGTLATGGFSTRNVSMAAFSPYIQWVTIVFMFLAGVNFILHYQAFCGRPKSYFKDEEFRNYFILIFVMILLSAEYLISTHASAAPIRDAAFQVVSIITTTGYTTVDFDAWPNALRFLLVMLMFIGGCGGSTGGGMKFIRFFLSIKISAQSVIQTIFPNAIVPVTFNKRALPDKVLTAIVAYFVIFMHLFFFGSILFIVTESCDIVTAITASLSALSNIGPGLGEVGASKNFAWVSIQGKWLLTFLMLAGRLELYSILILFAPSTWRK